MSVPLTTHLTSLSTPRPYSAATEHAFLTAAGTGALPLPLLSLYLSQDRIYAAHAYPRFLGQLLARVPFSSQDAPDAPTERFHGEIVGVLADALQNVRREVAMFADVERAHALEFGRWRERKATRDYTAEMARVGALGSFEDGLVFLWAMERVYLDAWNYVKSLLPNATAGAGSALPAVKELVENWTNPEFVRFVDVLGDLVNRLSIAPGTPAFLRAEEIWARVVELEEAFWPVVGEELAALSV
ncbi:heme oxygenase-like protein [Trametes versicolor FP-101664 SS1]|uniref:heme oxygenase-like protein n=1 Tax=Trametes versicolor (strain FP-101664) TaxID=717944 RepID=UPI0004623085|nr:heme oxygenase-like protein [Trametes versicolor FP-101664 SS1]EIW55081.1 heme oxygenase-like protein [Trametes versicolor FP-101664 SS1]